MIPDQLVLRQKQALIVEQIKDGKISAYEARKALRRAAEEYAQAVARPHKEQLASLVATTNRYRQMLRIAEKRPETNFV